MTQKFVKLKKKKKLIIIIVVSTQEFNKLTAENFPARLAQKKKKKKQPKLILLISQKRTDFDHKLKNLNKKVSSNKTKHIQAETKITDLTIKAVQISEKGHDFLLG